MKIKRKRKSLQNIFRGHSKGLRDNLTHRDIYRAQKK